MKPKDKVFQAYVDVVEKNNAYTAMVINYYEDWEDISDVKTKPYRRESEMLTDYMDNDCIFVGDKLSKFPHHFTINYPRQKEFLNYLYFVALDSSAVFKNAIKASIHKLSSNDFDKIITMLDDEAVKYYIAKTRYFLHYPNSIREYNPYQNFLVLSIANHENLERDVKVFRSMVSDVNIDDFESPIADYNSKPNTSYRLVALNELGIIEHLKNSNPQFTDSQICRILAEILQIKHTTITPSFPYINDKGNSNKNAPYKNEHNLERWNEVFMKIKTTS